MHQRESPGKIAVVGVSPREEKFGFRIFKDLLNGGYSVYGVHPLGGERSGVKIYKDLDEIPGKIDTVVTVVLPEVTEKIVEKCRALGIKAVWMQPGSESVSAIAKAREYGITVTSGECFMKAQGIWR